MIIRIFSLATASLLASPAVPAEPFINSVEAVLSRSLLERGAFHACAPLSPDGAEIGGYLAKGWTADLSASVELLRGAGYPADFVDSIPDRFDLQKATPQFASPETLRAFCAMLGDWQTRYALFLASHPQFEIKKIIEK